MHPAARDGNPNDGEESNDGCLLLRRVVEESSLFRGDSITVVGLHSTCFELHAITAVGNVFQRTKVTVSTGNEKSNARPLCLALLPQHD